MRPGFELWLRARTGTARKCYRECCEYGKRMSVGQRHSLTWAYSRRLGRDQLHTGGGDDNESKLVENGHDCGDEKDKDGGE